MISGKEAHDKILGILERKGPSLPMQIAKEMNLSSLFIPAFLSEMVDSKKIRVSSLKVGGSPLYFVDKDEAKLEQFYTYLHPKEAEAFLLLKKNKAIKDRDQEPAIRVALRSLTDFAFSFIFEDELYWRYYTIPEIETRSLIASLKHPPTQSVTPVQQAVLPQHRDQLTTPEKALLEEKNVALSIKKDVIEVKSFPKEKISEKKEKQSSAFDNPLVIKKEEKQQKIKQKSDFVCRVIEFIIKNGFSLIEEKEYKAKEYAAIVQINTDLGPMNFFTYAKEKKSISDKDLIPLLSDAQRIPLPACIFYTGELTKKAKEYLIAYSSVLKAKKIE